MLRVIILSSLLYVSVALKTSSFTQADLASFEYEEEPEATLESKQASLEERKSINDYDEDMDDFDDLWTGDMKGRAKGIEMHNNKTSEMVDDMGDLWTMGIQERAAAKSMRKVLRQLHKSTAAHMTVFVGIIVLGILFEWKVLKTTFNKDLTIRDALVVLGSWLAATFLFLLYVGGGWGWDGISTFLDGYLLEMMLSVDNLFVFVLIMGSFHVPPKARSKVLMIGVLAALLLRIVMFGTIWFLISWADIVSKALGAFIIYCAYKVVMLDEDDDEEVTQNPMVQVLASYFPMTQDRDEEGSFFIKGKATSIFLAAGAMIFLDVIFAVDSVSAKTALIADQYLSYTSTGFCMFALRATYYLLDAAKDMFEHLKYGISAILALIGVKTMLPNMFFISDWQYLFLLTTILGSCIISSMLSPKEESQEDDLLAEDGNPNEPNDMNPNEATAKV